MSDGNGWSALHTAAESNHTEHIVRFLLQREAKVDAMDTDVDETPLNVPSECGNLAVCGLLLEYGANVHTTVSMFQCRMPLHVTASFGRGARLGRV